MSGHSEFDAWFRLLETPRLGLIQARQLLAAFGSAEAVLRAPPTSLRSFVSPALASAIAGPAPEGFSERLLRCHHWLDGSSTRHCLTLGDGAYPPRLLQTADPPLLLFVDGDVDRLSMRSLAIVGARNPTVQGVENARAFAAELGRAGLGIVSGLARGIDTAAHEGALLGQAPTLAVLGAGPDEPYPTRNAPLAARIVAAGGAVISEYAPGTPPLKENFPRRNRIIAGLSLGTLVVEAALRSGSLITARLASEAGREVFAIPGSIHSPQSKGCHALIKQGAKLVEAAADILEELALLSPAAPSPLQDAEAAGLDPDSDADLDDAGAEAGPGGREDPILRALGHDPTTMDALQARTGWPTADLAAGLLELELQEKVRRLPGGLYQRRAVA